MSVNKGGRNLKSGNVVKAAEAKPQPEVKPVIKPKEETMSGIKSDQQLAIDILNDYNTDPHVKRQAMYNLKSTGDTVKDFAKFTDVQSGGKSDDPNDPMAHYAPKIPYKDGRYYHTIRDIGYPTFLSVYPNSPVIEFYEMSDEKRNNIICVIMEHSAYTKDSVVDCMFAYIV